MGFGLLFVVVVFALIWATEGYQKYKRNIEDKTEDKDDKDDKDGNLQ